MQELLRRIRACLNVSQTELAAMLGVTFATVNRWENGRAHPNALAQTRLREVCAANAVPVYDLTLALIRKEAEALPVAEGRTVLYHGSKFGIEGRIEPKSRAQCDFGAGFYMGTDARQALTLICDYDTSRFYIVSVDIRALNVLEVPADLEWAMLVAYHRGRMERVAGTPLYERYRALTHGKDLIVGSIADDRMFYVIDNFFLGNITDAALVASLSALRLGRQYVAVTQKGCDAVRIEREIALSQLERRFIQNAAAANREKGVALAEEICRAHRREGLYFDELLERAGKEAVR